MLRSIRQEVGVVRDSAGNVVGLSAGGEVIVQNHTKQIHSGRIVADYSTLTGYVISGASNTMELAELPSGGCGRIKNYPTRGIRAVCGANGNVAVTSPVFEARGIPNGNIQAWVYVEDYTKITSFTMYFYTDITYAVYYVSSAFALQQYNGWHLISLDTDGLFVGAGSPTVDTITVARIRMDSATVGASIILDRVVFGAGGGGLVSLQWDDANKSDYNYVAPLLAKYGLVGNFAIIAENSWMEEDSANRLTLTEAKILAESGHRLMTHGVTNLSSLTYDEAIANIQENKTAIDALGVDTDSDVYVYPGGIYLRAANDLSIPQYLEANGFYGAFTTQGLAQGNNCKNRRFLMSRSETGQATHPTSATILALVDSRVSTGKNVSLLAHTIVASGATSNQMNLTILDELLSGLSARQQAGALRVVSAKELIRSSLY